MPRQVKINSNNGYDLFYSLEGSAILHRTLKLGDYFCLIQPALLGLKKTTFM